MQFPASRRVVSTIVAFALGLVPTLAAQSPQAGWRDVVFTNRTPIGAKDLLARVHYPAATAGQNAPFLAPPTGASPYPVVVFLHGFGALGRQYGDLGDAFAERGFVIVMSDTAQFDPEGQRVDGIALRYTLRAEAEDPRSPFFGWFDGDRIGLAGHSAGGGNVVRLLADGIGYRVGVAFAAWQGPLDRQGRTWADLFAPRVTAPLVLIHGEGDVTTPWQPASQAYFDRATGAHPLAAFYRLNGDAGHGNVVGHWVRTQADREVFARSLAVALGTFDHFLQRDPDRVDDALGIVARAAPRLVDLQVRSLAPIVWTNGEARPGQQFTLNVLGETGPFALLSAAALGSVPTPIGPLGLDPATLAVVSTGTLGGGGLFTSATITVPATVPGSGEAWLQAIATDPGGVPALSLPSALRVRP